jgi:hypothetical protein
MFLECDEVVVPEELLQRAINGNTDAVRQLRESINGVTLYMHAFFEPVRMRGSRIVTLRQLSALNIPITATIGFVG